MSWQGAGTGAAGGAAAGSTFGPWGAGIGAGLGALLGAFGSGGGDKNMSPELQRLYNRQAQQMARQSPLVEAAYRLAFSRLPTAARAGVEAPSLERALADTPEVTDGDYAESAQVRQALRLMEVRQRMAEPLIQAVTQMAMHRLPTSVQSALNARDLRGLYPDNTIWGSRTAPPGAPTDGTAVPRPTGNG